jgi:hypothetical protein
MCILCGLILGFAGLGYIPLWYDYVEPKEVVVNDDESFQNSHSLEIGVEAREPKEKETAKPLLNMEDEVNMFDNQTEQPAGANKVMPVPAQGSDQW